jgi:hypothetical protein
MTSSCLILTVKFVFDGYRITAGPNKVTSREIEFGLSRDGLCGQPTGSERINRSVDALFCLEIYLLLCLRNQFWKTGWLKYGQKINIEKGGFYPYPNHMAEAVNGASRTDKCHSAAWESCSLTDESVTLLWLNPPYDDDRHGDEKRLELAFLKSTTPKLVRGGVLASSSPSASWAWQRSPATWPASTSAITVCAFQMENTNVSSKSCCWR